MTKRINPDQPSKTGPKGPWQMTPEVIQKLEQAFAIDATVGEACFYADISTSTYYNWVGANPELLDKFERLRHKPILKARQTVVNALDDPDHAKWYLKNKKNTEFSERVENENKTEMVIKDYSKLSDEELDKIISNE